MRFYVFLAALLCEVKGLDADAKYFLTRFVQLIGAADLTGLGVKAFAACFGLSDRQVTKSLSALVAYEVMAFSETPGGRGRPKRHYRLQEVFHENLCNASELLTTHHEIAVGNLLKHENRKATDTSENPEKRKLDVAALADLRNKRQPRCLSVVNRLLLSVMLCRADRTGVVRDLGSSALCKATGLSREGLKHRVQRLIDQGFIRAYVPGATSTVLSAKMKSTYFLNLNHSELSVEGGTTSVLVCAMSGDPSESVPHAYQIYRDIEILKRAPTFFADKKERYLRFFEGQPLVFFHLLQVMVEKYAADMLSKYWCGLDDSASNKWSYVQEWKERIREDFRFPKAVPDMDGDHLQKIDEGQYAAAINDLYYDAYTLATKIKNMLCQVSENSFPTMDFAILPQPVGLGCCGVKLLARSRDWNSWHGYLYFELYAEPQAFSSEAEIPLVDCFDLF